MGDEGVQVEVGVDLLNLLLKGAEVNIKTEVQQFLWDKVVLVVMVETAMMYCSYEELVDKVNGKMTHVFLKE